MSIIVNAIAASQLPLPASGAGRASRSQASVCANRFSSCLKKTKSLFRRGKSMTEPAGVERAAGVRLLALCGESLLMEGIEASLRDREGVEIVHVNTSRP